MASILPETDSRENQLHTHIDKFLSNFQFGKILRFSNFRKEKGYSCLDVFKILFLLVFTGKNLYQYLQSEKTTGMV